MLSAQGRRSGNLKDEVELSGAMRLNEGQIEVRTERQVLRGPSRQAPRNLWARFRMTGVIPEWGMRGVGGTSEPLRGVSTRLFRMRFCIPE
jgi:hypothetical protein